MSTKVVAVDKHSCHSCSYHQCSMHIEVRSDSNYCVTTHSYSAQTTTMASKALWLASLERTFKKFVIICALVEKGQRTLQGVNLKQANLACAQILTQVAVLAMCHLKA
jgi:hypothetical protein